MVLGAPEDPRKRSWINFVAGIFNGKSIGFRIDFDDAFLSIVGPLQQRHTDGGLPLTSGLPLASGLLRRGNE